MEGYTYIENGIPVISAERKPRLEQFENYSIVQTITDIDGYETALKEWKKTLIPVKNKTHRQHDDVTGEPTGWGLMDFPNFGNFTGITPGQKVQYNKGEITRIL